MNIKFMNKKDKEFCDKEEEGKIAIDLLREKKIEEIAKMIELRIFNCDIQGMISSITFYKLAEKIINFLEE